MFLDPELQQFLHKLQTLNPLPRDPNDLAAFVRRYEAISAVLPESDEPVRISAGTFHLTVLACGEKTRLDARLYLPEKAAAGHDSETSAKPPLMVYFHGGGWVAGSLASHDGFCRQLCHDLKIGIASVHLPLLPGCGFIQLAEQALQVLLALSRAREKLGVDTSRLLVGGDGSGAHLGLQAAWRLARQSPGSVDAVLAITPLVKPDFNTPSYIRNASSMTFSRDDAVRSWYSLLGGRWETWDERAVLLHSNQPVQRPPLVVVVAAEHDGAHDDAAALHDWLKEAGARCEYYGAPGMPHDFVRLQHASRRARQLVLAVLDAFASHARLDKNSASSAVSSVQPQAQAA